MISLSKLFTAEKKKKNRLIISSPILIQEKDMGFLLVLLVPCNSNWDLNLHSWDLNPAKTQIGTWGQDSNLAKTHGLLTEITPWFQDLMKLRSWCLITERIQWETK